MKSTYVEPLDWLRGLMALMIMVYHYVSWIYSEPLPGTFLGKIGIYGVSIFFVLSGLSMSIGYSSKLKGTKEIVAFIIRRIFRIWPLLWMVTLGHMVAQGIVLKIDSRVLGIILLNLTTLFGFFKPDAYIATGSWSIGNEVVYYSLTPLLILICNKYKKGANYLFIIACLIEVVFLKFKLIETHGLVEQWNRYINPLNNLFLYVAGINIYYNFKNKKLKKEYNLLFLAIAWVLFYIIPCKGDSILLVTGYRRYILSLISIWIVISFYKLSIDIPSKLKEILNYLGSMTYSVYLLHPLVYILIKNFIKKGLYLNNFILLVMACVCTLLLSLLVYQYYERPFIEWGKLISKRIVKY